MVTAGTQDREGRLNRQVSLKAATISVIGALLVGVLTAVLGLIGVFVTTSSAAEQSRLSFLRPEQQTLYAQFLTAVDDAHAKVNIPGDEAVTYERYLVARTAFVAVVDLVAQIELVGSRDTIVAAKAIQGDLFDELLEVIDVYCEQNGDCPVADPPPNVEGYTPPWSEPIAEQRQAFVDRARGDIGTD